MARFYNSFAPAPGFSPNSGADFPQAGGTR
jgi:hypothetical protein